MGVIYMGSQTSSSELAFRMELGGFIAHPLEALKYQGNSLLIAIHFFLFLSFALLVVDH